MESDKSKKIGTKKYVKWTKEERLCYKEHKRAIDRETQFELAKKLYSINNNGYASVGDLLSDELHKCVLKYFKEKAYKNE